MLKNLCKNLCKYIINFLFVKYIIKKAYINKIFEIFSKNNPHPKTELVYKNNYTLLVAVVLSAQSTDKGVNKATEKLFKIVSNPYEMIELGEKKLKNYINIIGLFNNKAKNIIALSHQLIDKYKGQVPDDFEALKELPGVGRKTANVVLNCAFNKPTIAVDTHIFRLANRIGLVNEDDVLRTELQLLKIVPKKYMIHAHHWLILHGRYICIARKPKCEICQINKYCLSFKAK